MICTAPICKYNTNDEDSVRIPRSERVSEGSCDAVDGTPLGSGGTAILTTSCSKHNKKFFESDGAWARQHPKQPIPLLSSRLLTPHHLPTLHIADHKQQKHAAAAGTLHIIHVDGECAILSSSVRYDYNITLLPRNLLRRHQHVDPAIRMSNLRQPLPLRGCHGS